MEDLKYKKVAELEAIYEDLFKCKAPSKNKVFLRRKILYRHQELEFGGLSARVKDKLEELIQKYEPINNKLLRPENDTGPTKQPSRMKDRRLPIPGSIIVKKYHGQKLMVKVLENGLEYNGVIYRSLSGVALAITGQHWNGYAFFGL